MVQFDILGTLKTYCENLGIVFIWQYDEFYANISATQQYDNDQLILVADLRPNPTINGSKVTEITYSGLLMLGRKFETGGTVASLDETQQQKYETRLQELTASLVSLGVDFACDNDLTVEFGQIDYLINLFDANIDFVAAQSISFVQ